MDVVRAIDAGLSGADDPSLLTWAAEEGRLILTHDAMTMAGFAYERVSLGLKMPGVIEVPTWLQMGQVIDELLLLASASHDGEWEGQVIFLPV